jgi:hypothetical protein
METSLKEIIGSTKVIEEEDGPLSPVSFKRKPLLL